MLYRVLAFNDQLGCDEKVMSWIEIKILIILNMDFPHVQRKPEDRKEQELVSVKYCISLYMWFYIIVIVCDIHIFSGKLTLKTSSYWYTTCIWKYNHKNSPNIDTIVQNGLYKTTMKPNCHGADKIIMWHHTVYPRLWLLYSTVCPSLQ